jgi:hypothetical protein
MQIYHKNVHNGVPKTELTEKGVIDVSLSHHAHMQSMQRGIDIPSRITYQHENVIELYMFDEIHPDRIVLRVAYNARYDLCFVYSPNSGNIITVWLNSVWDSHKTLDVSKYI